MKKQLFGGTIAPSCSYCSRSKKEGSTQFCSAHKVLKNGKCRKFDYNPIMREPLGAAKLPTFSKKDFSIDE